MTDELIMSRAIALALLGGKATRSNPAVGAVIVSAGGRIIGEGYHQQYGGPHAEVMAINSVKSVDRDLLSTSTIYITLEPCNHHGKTPPCTDLIQEHQIPTVVIGCLDPSPQMAGRSVQELREEGILVHVGVCEQACLDLIRPFVAHASGIPYVYIKQAASANGYIGKKGHQVWITGALSRAVSHHWRSRVDAILVGTNTMMIDRPRLSTRDVSGPSPLRVVLDRHGKIDGGTLAYVDGSPTLVYSEQSLELPDSVEVVVLAADQWTIGAIISDLYQRGIYYLLVEGGPTLIQSVLNAGLAHEALDFRSSTPIDGDIRAVNVTGRLATSIPLGRDTYRRLLIDV